MQMQMWIIRSDLYENCL